MLLSVCHLGMFFALLFLDAMCFRYILASAEAKMKINVSDHGFYALSICTGSAKHKSILVLISERSIWLRSQIQPEKDVFKISMHFCSPCSLTMQLQWYISFWNAINVNVKLILQNGEERKVILFHYTEWPCHSNPFSNALLEFRRRVRNVMNHHPDTQDGPVIVHCKWVHDHILICLCTANI